MIDGLIILGGLVVFYLIAKHLVSIYRDQTLTRFLNEVSKPVGKGNFDYLSTEKAGKYIYYGNLMFAGLSSASCEGIYIESLWKFYVEIPWDNIAAIRVVRIGRKRVANLRIYSESGINRKLSVPWNPKFRKYIPEGVTYIEGELWSNLVYDEFIKRRPDLSFHSL